MRLNQLILTTAAATFLLIGCNNDDGGPILPETGTDSPVYENGIIVVNEGGFMNGNASVSFLSDDSGELTNDIFSIANGVDAWGDTAQSMAFDGETGYIVVNGSQKVEVVDRYTFESMATIGGADFTDFLNPRYMAIANGKGYVTNWGDGSDPSDDFVAVINLETNIVERKIPVGEGPERLLVKDNTLYVAMLGGFNFNNSVAVIDTTSDTVTDSIMVGEGPNSLQFDADGNLWVLSGGKPAYTEDQTAGRLDKIDTASNAVTKSFSFLPTEHPEYLSYEDGSLYYNVAGGIFKMDVSSTVLPEKAAITGTNFYDMAVNDGKLYGTDAKDFASNGTLEIYGLSDNFRITTKEVGINPGAIYFNGSAEK
ncbi:YncE family protein [Pricia sp.]|uniref:YncE family protein n=1 Tax=Pricia sp. TaxID=2268138 RepID=UPI00359426D2